MVCRYRAVLRAPLPLDDELTYRCVRVPDPHSIGFVCSYSNASAWQALEQLARHHCLDRLRLDPITGNTERGTMFDTSVRVELSNGAVNCCREHSGAYDMRGIAQLTGYMVAGVPTH